jgi:N-acylneuraminate cytidylyltransferase
LIAYSIAQGLKAKHIDRLIVSTDDLEIKTVAEKFGAEVPFLRPDHLASSTASSFDSILHAVDYLAENGESYDTVCLLQATSPFRPVGIIDRALRKYQDEKLDSLVSLRKVPDHYNPYWTFIEQEEGIFGTFAPGELISRRQDLPAAYHRDGALYILSVESMRKTGKLLGPRLGGIEIESPELINIDSNSDWEIAERYMDYATIG